MDLEMRLEIVQCFYACGRSATQAIRDYKTKHGIVDNPCTTQAVTKLIAKFETTYSLHDAPKLGRKPREKDEELEKIENAIQSTKNEMGSTSIRTLSKTTGIAKTTVHYLLRHEMELYPYRLQTFQTINDNDKRTRLDFVRWMRANEEKVPQILWSDEAYFHLSGDISTYHCRIWSDSKPTHYLTKPLHPKKLCAWVGFTEKLLLVPYIFDETISSESYLDMLINHVRPQLARHRLLSKTIFMQDGAPPHYANSVRNWLIETFSEDRVISRGCKITWPARSPDINPLDFWFWGTLKARVFHSNAPTSINQLKARIIEECQKFTLEERINAIGSLWRRCDILEKVKGDHFQQYL